MFITSYGFVEMFEICPKSVPTLAQTRGFGQEGGAAVGRRDDAVCRGGLADAAGDARQGLGKVQHHAVGRAVLVEYRPILYRKTHTENNTGLSTARCRS